MDLNDFKHSVMTLIENAVVAGVPADTIGEELRNLAGHCQDQSYTGLVDALVADIVASCECAPSASDVDTYLEGLAVDVRAAMPDAEDTEAEEDRDRRAGLYGPEYSGEKF